MDDRENQADNELRERIRSGKGVRSLDHERHVAETLRSIGWNTIHSCYYIDSDEDKLREVDVVASRRWRVPSDHGFICITVHLVIECKSLDEYHLIFSGNSNEPWPIELPLAWLGDEAACEQLEELLGEKLPRERAGKLLHRARELSGSILPCIGELLKAPPASFLATSFKETNPSFRDSGVVQEGKSRELKDLDNSVLWRALRSIRSAQRSFCRDAIGVHKKCIQRALAQAEENHWNDDQRFDAVELRSVEVELFHPVVVLEARLWDANSQPLNPIDSCRLKFRSIFGNADLWCDVVRREAFADLGRHISVQYEQRFLGHGATEAPAY